MEFFEIVTGIGVLIILIIIFFIVMFSIKFFIHIFIEFLPEIGSFFILAILASNNFNRNIFYVLGGAILIGIILRILIWKRDFLFSYRTHDWWNRRNPDATLLVWEAKKMMKDKKIFEARLKINEALIKDPHDYSAIDLKLDILDETQDYSDLDNVYNSLVSAYSSNKSLFGIFNAISDENMKKSIYKVAVLFGKSGDVETRERILQSSWKNS